MRLAVPVRTVLGRSWGLLVAALSAEWNCWRSMNSSSMILGGDEAMGVGTSSSTSGSTVARGAGVLMRALEMQARLLELRSLGWRHVCLASGWT